MNERFHLKLHVDDDVQLLLSSDSFAHLAESARAVYPQCEIGHEGDISDYGDMTFIWRTQEEKIDDESCTHHVGVIRRTMRSNDCIRRIHRLLDGHPWTADTLQAIADALVSYGLEIADPKRCADAEAAG